MNLETTLKKLARTVAVAGLLSTFSFTSSCATTLRDLSPSDRNHHVNVTFRANKLSGIQNPERYHLEVLEESNRNLTDPTYRPNDPIALFFFSEYDKPVPGVGIFPLDFVAPRVADFIHGYKVMVFEAESTDEMKQHMAKVAALHPRRGRIAGLVFAGHGNEATFTLGDTDKIFDHARYQLHKVEKDIPGKKKARKKLQKIVDMNLTYTMLYQLFVPYTPLFAQDAVIFHGTCYGGKGEEKDQNYVNALAALFEGRRVYGCNDVLTGFDYDLDEQNHIVPDSIELSSFVSDCTYVAQCDDDCSFKRFRYAISTSDDTFDVKKMWKELHEEGIPKETLELLAIIWPTSFRAKNVSDQLRAPLNLKAFSQDFDIHGNPLIVSALQKLAEQNVTLHVVTYYCHEKHTGELKSPQDILKRQKGQWGKALYPFLQGPYCEQLFDF